VIVPTHLRNKQTRRGAGRTGDNYMAGPFGGMPNIGKLMKEAQQMGEKMKKVEAELNDLHVEAASGGGMVKAIVTGSGDLVSVKIAPEVVDPEDVEMLEDLVVTAIREALESAQTLREEKLGAVTSGLQGMKMPGLPF
jgi:DNA-binding YbaB/EbfC family protein